VLCTELPYFFVYVPDAAFHNSRSFFFFGAILKVTIFVCLSQFQCGQLTYCALFGFEGGEGVKKARARVTL
jgi:hypothetical protein